MVDISPWVFHTIKGKCGKGKLQGFTHYMKSIGVTVFEDITAEVNPMSMTKFRTEVMLVQVVTQTINRCLCLIRF